MPDSQTTDPLLHDYEAVSERRGGLSTRKIAYLVAAGELATVRIGRRVFVTDVELRRYVDSLADR